MKYLERISFGFFLGVFTCFCGIGIFILATNFFSDKILLIAIGVFSSAIIFTFVLFLIIRNILMSSNKIYDFAHSSNIKNIINKIQKHIKDGDSRSAINQAFETLPTAANWFVSYHFYKNFGRFFAGIIITFAALSGAILLIEQNRKLAEQTEQLALQNKHLATQNALLNVRVVPQLRAQLAAASKIESEPFRLITDGYSGDRCSLIAVDDKFDLFVTPSPRVIKSIVQLAKSASIGKLVQDGLRALLHDPDGNVVLGAILVLDEVGGNFGEIPLTGLPVRNTYISDIVLENSIHISFEDSIINNFYCFKCVASFNNSVVSHFSIHEISALSYSFLDSREAPQRDRFFYKTVGFRREFMKAIPAKKSHRVGNGRYNEPTFVQTSALIGQYTFESKEDFGRRSEFIVEEIKHADSRNKNYIIEPTGNACKSLSVISRNNQFLKFEASSN